MLKAIERNGWLIAGHENLGYFSLEDLDTLDENNKKIYDLIFYKEKFIVHDKSKYEQRLIVTFSLKYQKFLKAKRLANIERAQKKIANKNRKQLLSLGSKDVSRYVYMKITDAVSGEEIEPKVDFVISKQQIDTDEKFEGFYAVATSLYSKTMPIRKIIEINKHRWEIEESFMMLKSYFKSRPVYLTLKEHIQAHFTICFTALMAFRILEQKVNKITEEKLTAAKLLSALRSIKLTKMEKYYVGAFNRTTETDLIHKVAGMNFDCQLITPAKIESYLKELKKIK